MALDYAICPHCGCRCEDDEYCAACARMFDEDQRPTRQLTLGKVICGGLRSQAKRFHVEAIKHDDEMFREEPEFDPTWSFLATNIYNRKD